MAQDPQQKKKNRILLATAIVLFLLAGVLFIVLNRPPTPEVGTAGEEPEFIGSPNRAVDPENAPDDWEEEELELETGDQ